MQGAMGWVGTMQLWLNILPHLFISSATHYTLPGPWGDTRPDLSDTQLQVAWVATPGGSPHATLVCYLTPAWLSSNSLANRHRLLCILVPLNCQFWVGSYPWCLYITACLLHTLHNCADF